MTGISLVCQNITLYDGGRLIPISGVIDSFAQMIVFAAWQSCMLAQNGCCTIDALLSKESWA